MKRFIRQGYYVPPRGPKRKWVYLAALLLGFLIACEVHGQTVDCDHDPSHIQFYKNCRIMVGQVSEQEGNELTLVAKDRKEVSVLHIHLASDTQMQSKKNGTIHKLEKISFVHGKEFYLVVYCVYCNKVFAITRLDL